MIPQIVLDPAGHHNNSDYSERLKNQKLYQDCSTVCIVPTRGKIAAPVVQNWMGLMTPMNQKFFRIFAIGLEVGAAYEETINGILNHPELQTWKYVLTLEEDNMPPPDGLIRLIQSIGDYGAVGGLYWTKGEAGQPMCYGDPAAVPINFIPQIPEPGTIKECNGLGMGFTLFKMKMLKDLKAKMQGPMFQTVQRYEPGKGGQAYTQDLYFFEQARKFGYRFACDANVRVGHYEEATGKVW